MQSARNVVVNVINQQVSSYCAEVQSNREHLAIIIDVIIFLSKQGLAFRGHNEDLSNKNQGNFLEHLHFIGKYVPKFQAWQKVNSFKYTSPDVQNEIINIIANMIRKKIVETITKNGLFWSLIADETTDLTRIEQFTFNVRFADPNLNVFERFRQTFYFFRIVF